MTKQYQPICAFLSLLLKGIPTRAFAQLRIKTIVRKALLGMIVLVCCLVLPAWGQQQDQPPQTAAVHGIPYDWTHRHLIFSKPSSPQALQKLQRNPRYQIQQAWRSRQRLGNSAAVLDAKALQIVHSWGRPPRVTRVPLTRDWGDSTGTTAYAPTSPTYPAEFTSGTAPDCTKDFVVFTLNNATSPNFNIIGFNNLYGAHGSGTTAKCTGTVPSVLFSYYASTGTTKGGLNGSPTLSIDSTGSQIAFVENASSGAIFHLLKWRSGDMGATFPQGSLINDSGHNCATNGGTAPCEYSLTYSTTTATLSSPWVDYSSDTAYVSDDSGKVYAIHPVFHGGSPALVTNAVCTASGNPYTCCTSSDNGTCNNWPITVSAGSVLTPPVFDSGSLDVGSNNIFVSTVGGVASYIRTTSTAGCTSGATVPCVGTVSFSFGSGGNIVDSPIVDSSTGRVFLFAVTSNNTGAAPAITMLGRGSFVAQTDTALGTPSAVLNEGQGDTLPPIPSGALDNAYFSSVATGHLYECMQNEGIGHPILNYMTFNASGVMNGFTTTPHVACATAQDAISPLTENAVSSAPVSNESYGTVTASTGPYTHTAATPPALPDSVTVEAGSVTGTDNGAGAITGTGIAAGTINYTTGAMSLTFAAGNLPATGTTITVSYTPGHDRMFFGATDDCNSPVFTGGGTGGCVSDADITNAFGNGASITGVGVAESVGTSGIIIDNSTDVSSTVLTTDVYFLTLGAQSCTNPYTGASGATGGICAVSAAQSSLQ